MKIEYKNIVVKQLLKYCLDWARLWIILLIKGGFKKGLSSNHYSIMEYKKDEPCSIQRSSS
jgi:hypothetical protein